MNRVVIGLQFGDEGKGKIVDWLAEQSHPSASIRFNGGDNAGHTVRTAESAYSFRCLPASALHKGMRCVLGRGMVMSPDVVAREIREVSLINPTVLVFIDPSAQVTLPIHGVVDRRRDNDRSLGSTMKGVGPAQADRINRVGITYGELAWSDPDSFVERCRNLYGQHDNEEAWPGGDWIRTALSNWREALAPHVDNTAIDVVLTAMKVHEALFAGAHGMGLDLYHGTYPYVTSTSCMAAMIGPGAGADLRQIDEIIGVIKPYVTRYEPGPLPTQMELDRAELIRHKAHEYGTITGRPRKIGWLDLAPIRYAARINGVDTLALTKLDVLTGVDPIKVCVDYSDETDSLAPLAVPIWGVIQGWHEEITEVRSRGDLPKQALILLDLIERNTGLPIEIISVGSTREATFAC